MDFAALPIDALISATAIVFIAIDPLGLAPIFISVTNGMSAAQRRQVAVWAFAISLAILFGFALFGQALLEVLGVGLPAFRVAGGILLFVIAFEMLFEKRQERKEEAAELMTSEDVRNLAAFPLAIPLMAGPGAITAVILLAAQAGDNTVHLIGLLLVVAAILLICLGVFLAAGRVNHLLGQTGRIVLTRLLAIILAALAVQFVADGVRAMIG